MVLDLQSRMNLITGDSGLGKSFLLDVAWWALTGRWPRDLNSCLTSGYAARPTNIGIPAKLRFELADDGGKSIGFEGMYSVMNERWTGPPGRPWSPGLVVHARDDGGFSVWDPVRNYWRKRTDTYGRDRLPGYVFSSQEIWNGLVVPIAGRSTKVCKGLLDEPLAKLFPFRWPRRFSGAVRRLRSGP